MAPQQLAEVVALQDAVVELEERQPLLTLQPQAHAVEREHPVDAEMRPDLAQQLDIAEFVEPVGVVRHDCVGGAVAEAQKWLDVAADARHVACDLRVAQQLPRLLAEGRVADARRAAAHQRHRPVAVALKQPQQHDLHHVADMQAVRGAIEADIAADHAGAQCRTQRLVIGALVDEAARGRFGKEIAARHDGVR